MAWREQRETHLWRLWIFAGLQRCSELGWGNCVKNVLFRNPSGRRVTGPEASLCREMTAPNGSPITGSTAAWSGPPGTTASTAGDVRFHKMKSTPRSFQQGRPRHRAVGLEAIPHLGHACQLWAEQRWFERPSPQGEEVVRGRTLGWTWVQSGSGKENSKAN